METKNELGQRRHTSDDAWNCMCKQSILLLEFVAAVDMDVGEADDLKMINVIMMMIVRWHGRNKLVDDSEDDWNGKIDLTGTREQQ